jgi:hypothetical protein
MSANEWAGIAFAVTTIDASFEHSVRWLVKHYLAELKPNSGSSLRDSVNRLESRIDEVFMLLAGKKDE